MDWLMELDGNCLLWIQENMRRDWMTGFWKGITSLGNYGWFWIALSVCLLLFARTRKAGFTALLALIIGTLITNLWIKNMVARVRPYEVLDQLILLIPTEKDFSFPSGHTCASFAAAFAMWRTKHCRWTAAALILAVLIAWSRLYVGVHYPTDVLGGLVIGLFSGWAASQLVKYRRTDTGASSAS